MYMLLPAALGNTWISADFAQKLPRHPFVLLLVNSLLPSSCSVSIISGVQIAPAFGVFVQVPQTY